MRYILLTIALLVTGSAYANEWDYRSSEDPINGSIYWSCVYDSDPPLEQTGQLCAIWWDTLGFLEFSLLPKTESFCEIDNIYAKADYSELVRIKGKKDRADWIELENTRALGDLLRSSNHLYIRVYDKCDRVMDVEFDTTGYPLTVKY